MSEYSYTKNIRFKLIPTFEGELQKLEEKKLYSLEDLSLELKKFLESFAPFIYYVEEKKVKSLKKKIKIHRNWLKKFCKLNFYENTKNLKQKTAHFPIKSIDYLKTEIDQWIKENTESIEEIEKIQNQLEHSQKRRSEAAFCLQKILRRKNFMITFLEEVRPENKDTHINDLKKTWKKITEILESIIPKYLPSQTAGVAVAKGSMNYYTVNKRPKDYQEELNDLEKQLNEDNYSYLQSSKKDPKGKFDLKDKNDNPIFTFTSEQEKEWLHLKCKLDFHKDIYSDEYIFQEKKVEKIKVVLNITQTYELMKQFKSEQKAIFNEIMTKIANQKQEDYKIENKSFILYKSDLKIKQSEFDSLEKVNKLFGLFQFETYEVRDKYGNIIKEYDKDIQYKKYIKLTKHIQTKGNAQKRGQLLFGKFAYFKKYANFCETFKQIAMKKGKLISQVKGIEKEKLEAEMTSHWSFIYEDPSTKKHYLWLIDKNKVNLAEVKEYIEKLGKHRTEGSLFMFHSFTKRALHKLCFAEESSFVKGLPAKLKSKQSQIKQFSVKGENGIDENLQKKKDQLELEFLKAVLDSDYAKKNLDLKNKYDLEKVHESKNLNEFEITLEEACYKKDKYLVSPETREEIIKKFEIKEFLITSYDLERKEKDIQKKAHTQLWEKVWKEDSEVRLNPEVVIRYRKADEDIQSFFKEIFFKKKEFNKLPYQEKQKVYHRKLQEQYTGSFTLSLNAGKKHPQLAFCPPDELKKEIDNFNQKFNQDIDFKSFWKYGIDRGNIELATLCIAKFDEKEQYEYNGKKYLNPTFPGESEKEKKKEIKEMKCYELKKEHLNYSKKLKETDEKEKKIIDNCSYFPVEEYKDLYEEKSVACMDLTTAKVIKDKIILNGDVKTYLKLKKESAKRRIYELYFKGQIQEDERLHFIDHAEGLIVPTSIKKYSDILDKKIENTEKAKYQIYFFSDKYKKILPKGIEDTENKDTENKDTENKDTENKDTENKGILKNLNDYLNKLKKEKKKLEELKKKGELKEISQEEESKHTPTIYRINNIRKALVSNMVGVITHLQKTYEGIVILEDLDKETLEEHFTQFNENIGRILENSLYQKFQTLGKVPPHIKNVIQLREQIRESRRKNKKTFQLGCIVFVDESGTSANCPHCENKIVKDNKKKNDEKFTQHRFLCGDKKMCDFDSYLFVKDEDRVKPPESKHYVEVKEENKEKFSSEDDKDKNKLDFKEINDPDKVAAYNVAKKIQNKDIPPLYTPPPPNKNHDNRNKNHQNRGKSFKNKGNQKGHVSNYNHSKNKKNYDKKGFTKKNESNGTTFSPFVNLKDQLKGNQK